MIALSPNRLGPLSERRFRLLWFSRTASSFGDSLISVALAFAVLRVGGSATDLGIVVASSVITRGAFVVIGGVWADRLPRRQVMLICDIIRAGVEALVAAALLIGFMQWWLFLITASVFGAASAFFGPASTGLVPQTVSPARLQQANASLSLSQTGTSIIGPAISGLIVAATDPAYAFAIDSATFIASGACLAQLRLPYTGHSVQSNFFADLRDGWREVRSRSWLWSSFINFAMMNFAVGVIPVLGPQIAERELGGARDWGLILTAGAIGGFAGGILVYRLLFTHPLRICYASWLLMAAPLFGLGVSRSLLAIMVANGLFGLGIAVGNTVWETVVQRQIDPGHIARVSSIDWMVSLVFMPLGSALAGALAASVGTEATLLSAASLIAGTNILTFVTFPAIRNLAVSKDAPGANSPAELATYTQEA